LEHIVYGVKVQRHNAESGDCLCPCLVAAVGFQKIVERGFVGDRFLDLQLLRFATTEEILPHLRQAAELVSGLLHRLQSLKLEFQRSSHFRTARFFFTVGIRKKEAGLQVSEPGRHHEIVGRQLQSKTPRLAHEFQVLIRQLEDGDILEIDFLIPRQLEKRINGTFIAFQVDTKALPFRDETFLLIFEVLIHSPSVLPSRARPSR